MSRSTAWSDRGLLLLRVGLGLVFVMHGWQKLFVFGHAGVTGAMTSLGIPFPALNAVLITAAEFGGGLALLAGLGTRAASAVLAFSMLVAVVTAHLSHGFFAPTGVEYPLTLLIVNLAVVLLGPGRYSLDAVISGRTEVRTEQNWQIAA